MALLLLWFICLKDSALLVANFSRTLCHATIPGCGVWNIPPIVWKLGCGICLTKLRFWLNRYYIGIKKTLWHTRKTDQSRTVFVFAGTLETNELLLKPALRVVSHAGEQNP